MQPFDYRLAVQNPVAMALQGYMQGQQFQNQRVQAERDAQLYTMQMQQYQMQQQQLAQEQARAQQMQADLGEFADAMENGTATRDMLTRLEFKYGDIIGEHVSAAYEGKSQEYKDAQASKIARIGIAFKNSPEEGMRLLQIEKEAAQNAGDQQLLDSIEMMEGEAKISSAAPTASSLFVLGKLLPPEQFEAFQKAIFPERPELPAAVQTFEALAERAGIQPGTPEYARAAEEAMSGGGTNVSFTMPGAVEEGAFERKVGELQATSIEAIAQQGQTSRRNRQTINLLERALTGAPAGIEAGLKGLAVNFGIETEGSDQIEVAKALISQLVPGQRPPGSGTMSDADLQLFKDSLPKLMGTSEGRLKIVANMKAISDYMIAEGDLADAVLDGTISRAQYRERVRALGNPLAEFSAGAGTPQARRRFDAQGREIK